MRLEPHDRQTIIKRLSSSTVQRAPTLCKDKTAYLKKTAAEMKNWSDQKEQAFNRQLYQRLIVLMPLGQKLVATGRIMVGLIFTIGLLGIH
jgi:hypothetical protein